MEAKNLSAGDFTHFGKLFGIWIRFLSEEVRLKSLLMRVCQKVIEINQMDSEHSKRNEEVILLWELQMEKTWERLNNALQDTVKTIEYSSIKFEHFNSNTTEIFLPVKFCM